MTPLSITLYGFLATGPVSCHCCFSSILLHDLSVAAVLFCQFPQFIDLVSIFVFNLLPIGLRGEASDGLISSLFNQNYERNL